MVLIIGFAAGIYSCDMTCGSQEQVFTLGASRVEVTFFTNLLTVIGMMLSTMANGNLIEFVRYASGHREATIYMVRWWRYYRRESKELPVNFGSLSRL